ncbi:NUDIX domain-containing protein [Actinomycetaceae bacterium TAE3-ERU4]|nr:NUDIX domain-containing protein [Actinomycetaceae bacterium TAE3-ERU4]
MTNLVAAAAIVDRLDNPTLLLCAQRSYPPELKGMWELPGGKVEVGETPRAALCRELHEELGVKVRFGPRIHSTIEAIDEETRRAWHEVYADGGVYANQVDGDFSANHPNEGNGDWPLVADLRMRVWVCELDPAGANDLVSLDGGHQNLKWVPWARVLELQWLPADYPIIEEIRKQVTGH